MNKLAFICLIFIVGCQLQSSESEDPKIYLGADLSYVNEIIDCGGEYRSEGEVVDPYQLFSDKGNNLVRLRLWHSPIWAGYSNFEDVKLAIKRSKAQGMEVLLDFHYSDTWADPQHQVIPEAWHDISDLEVLTDSLYRYTYETLQALRRENLVPEFVQVGNETNIEILQDSASMNVETINWFRNLKLLNAGLQAVADFSAETDISVDRMIHIAQPENAIWWFRDAFDNGLQPFEWIGLSYYPKWSTYGLEELSVAIDSLITTYDIGLMIVETAYPQTLVNVDGAHNILGEDALISGYSATPAGQLAYMKRLTEVTIYAGGQGVIYWEPAWVTSDCSTLWGKGSHWDNAAFFDGENGNDALVGFEFYQYQ